jgi:hypothetical protein
MEICIQHEQNRRRSFEEVGDGYPGLKQGECRWGGVTDQRQVAGGRYGEPREGASRNDERMDDAGVYGNARGLIQSGKIHLRKREPDMGKIRTSQKVLLKPMYVRQVGFPENGIAQDRAG